MWNAYNESGPKVLQAGEWHIPFGDDLDEEKITELYYEVINNDRAYNHISSILETKVKIATARCARVSYTVVGEEGKPSNYANDIKLHDRLVESGHWSPAEHCAKVMSETDYYERPWSRNFKGFIQYRELIS